MNESDIKIIRKEIIDLTCEFLETWIHQILYQCHLYPREVFETKKKFRVPVKVATHPGVQSYISTFVQSCYPLIENNELKSVSLTIIEVENVPIEKYVFEFFTSFKKDDSITTDMLLNSLSIYSASDLEQQLRAALLKITSFQSTHKPTIPKDNRTFYLSIEKLETGFPEDENMDWIPSNFSYSWKNLTPLKSAHMDIFRFNTFVMEASKKGKERCL